MSNRHLMGRRQFLIASSTCVVAAATVGPRLFAATEAVVQPRRLVIGFASFEENATLVAAESIPAGDGAFISRGARVSVSGASGAPADPLSRRGVELLVNHSYFEGAERLTAPYLAWGCNRATGCQGNAVSFTVPIDDLQCLSLTIGAETGAPSRDLSRRDAMVGVSNEMIEIPVEFGLQNDASIKLTRGYYVIVPVFDTDADPSWSSYTIGMANGRRALVNGAGEVAPFEHFVVGVDYAAE